MQGARVAQKIIASCLVAHLISILCSFSASADFEFVVRAIATATSMNDPQTVSTSPYANQPVSTAISPTIFCQESESLFAGFGFQAPIWPWALMLRKLTEDSNLTGGMYKEAYVALMNCANAQGCAPGTLAACTPCSTAYGSAQTTWNTYLGSWSLLAQHQNARPPCEPASHTLFNRGTTSWVAYGYRWPNQNDIDGTNVQIDQPVMAVVFPIIVPPLPS